MDSSYERIFIYAHNFDNHISNIKEMKKRNWCKKHILIYRARKYLINGKFMPIIILNNDKTKKNDVLSLSNCRLPVLFIKIKEDGTATLNYYELPCIKSSGSFYQITFDEKGYVVLKTYGINH